MAIQMSATFVDDYDGSTDSSVKTRRFAFDVELELSDENHAKVVAALDDILGKARTVKKDATSVKAVPRSSRARNRRIKKWADENWPGGYPARGRRSKELEQAYVAATQDNG